MAYSLVLPISLATLALSLGCHAVFPYHSSQQGDASVADLGNSAETGVPGHSDRDHGAPGEANDGGAPVLADQGAGDDGPGDAAGEGPKDAAGDGAVGLDLAADDTCDGSTNQDVQSTFYRDADKDGFGDASDSIVTCSAPSGFVSDDSDCDDTQSAINPGATEICNGADDNCNGETDEGCLP